MRRKVEWKKWAKYGSEKGGKHKLGGLWALSEVDSKAKLVGSRINSNAARVAATRFFVWWLYQAQGAQQRRPDSIVVESGGAQQVC